MSDSPATGLTVAITGPTGTFGAGLVPLLEADERVGRIVGVARSPFDPASRGWEDMLDHFGERSTSERMYVVVADAADLLRHEETDVSPRMPNEDVAEALTAMVRLWSEIEDLEAVHDLPSTSMPDGGMAWMVHRWASGERLDAVLGGQDMAAGDFVRRCKQLVDLLDQVGKAATDRELRRTARLAVDAVLRGVVAADRLD